MACQVKLLGPRSRPRGLLTDPALKCKGDHLSRPQPLGCSA